MLPRLASALGRLKGWKTLLASLAIAVIGVLQSADWATIVGPRQVGPAMLVIGVVVGVLRTLTDSPVGRK